MKRITVNKETLLLLLPAFFFLGPIIALLGKGLSLSPADQEASRFVLGEVVPRLIGHSVLLLPAVILPATILGVFQAFMVVHTNLPARSLLNTLFILPLGLPLYVISFVYVGLFEYAGFIPSWLRGNWGFDLHRYFEIKSLGGIAAVFSLALAPYVYLAAKNAFLRSSMAMTATARTLGRGPFSIFCSIVLPYSRPWLFAAASIVAMETLADFGGVSVFNYDTLTTAIYGAWSSLFSLASAVRLCVILLVFALILLWAESALIGDKGILVAPAQRDTDPLFHFSWPGKAAGWGACLLVILFSLGIPLIQLLWWAWPFFDAKLISPLRHSLALSFGGAALICGLCAGVVFLSRKGEVLNVWLKNLSLLGYSLPGSLVAVAVFLFFAQLGSGVESLPLVLLCGYCVRFLNVSYRPQNTALAGVHHHMEQAARSLGAGEGRVLGRIYLPLISDALLVSFLLSFIEILKEMPMTLMLRPTRLNTLATEVYELTSEGEWERAAPAAVLIVLAGLLALIPLGRLEKRLP